MSAQLENHLYWKFKSYTFICAKDIYTLFDPEIYNLKPDPIESCCWDGFVISFRIKKKQLYIKSLDINCENDDYPLINGIPPVKTWYSNYHLYKNLNIPLTYTGKIVIGKHLKKTFQDHAFTNPHSYKITYELSFKNGILINSVETSSSYF